MEEKEPIDWRDIPANIRTQLLKKERRRGTLVWNSRTQGTYKK